MSATPHPGDPGAPPGPAAVVLLGPRGEVLASTEAVARLTGRTAAELRGTRLADLLTGPGDWPDLDELAAAEAAGSGDRALRRADGGTVAVRLDVQPLAPGDAGQLVTLTDRDAARRAEEDRALLCALFAQNRVGLAIHDRDLRMSRVTADPSIPVRGGAVPATFTLPAAVSDVLVPEDAGALLDRLSRVAATGEPLDYWEHSARVSAAPDQERFLAVSASQLQDSGDRLLGVLSVFTDITEQHLARRRMALLHTAAERIGPSLDVESNAEELAGVLVPEFADLAAVDLFASVLSGGEPGTRLLGVPVLRVAATTVDGEPWPDDTYRRGAAFRLDSLGEVRRPVGAILRDAEVSALRPSSLNDIAGTATALLPTRAGSRLTVPLRARGQILGSLSLWRAAARPPFTGPDTELVEEIGSRAALGIDNARRYTREHRTLETLQRSLLPRPVFEVSAAETAGSYVPANTAAGIGGGWYDVIPLSSARVAFVIGDVAGHGLNATATMGRLRTAVQTLADLDLAPDELLTRLDDLAIRLADVGPGPDDSPGGAVGATCLYCVYDPVTGLCSMAGAGRVPPVVARPGAPAEELPLKPGPALGVGGSPFETVRVRLDPGSLLLFFSDELVARAAREGLPDAALEPGDGQGQESGDGRPRETADGPADGGKDGKRGEDGPEDRADGSDGTDAGTDRARARRLGVLRERAAAGAADGDSPDAVGRAVLDALLPGRSPANDVALLVARVRSLPEGATADWEFQAEPTVVAEARDAVLSQLKDWDLTGNAFPTELIVSELITNAIRYAGGPVGLRLIRDETLICEVSDPSETQPHLRRARPTDEGGRGLFLVAQLAHRWGSRYTPDGKTIWTEQLLERG
ncbi:SpoIIE family protein phosphatase [Streptomyces marincola]|uniref:SpoIIE family protein phosphatase n=1 Tax=Streptomyces marincola TaxID=2878388 RepID=UPI001CF2ADCF|nr:SpoIIE family protein phosphatase [Streptomyces marincola]UCM86713.1 SpoIIE family protein phosphatase [Streptomyces marincola]